MIHATLSEAASAMGGSLLGADAPFAGVSTDSRSLPGGALFVALRGEHFDGHGFVDEAARRGAAGAVVEQPVAGASLPQIVVADTLAALAALARHWRQSLPARVVGVTGSNGKTTLRSLIAAILAESGITAGTRGNLNNEIGLPLTVLGLDRACDFAVLEMGAGKPGDIGWLARIGLPHVAVVNNVGPAHLERLGSIEGVARTKGEIYESLAADGIGVVNADDVFAPYFRSVLGARSRVEFGLDQPADISARDIEIGETCRFILVTPDGEARVDLPLPGRHNVMNALAAAACAQALGVGIGAIARGLGGAHGVAGRLTRHVSPAGWVLFDDTYNANPASTMAGIAMLAGQGGDTWVVLGDMKELGPRAAELHAEVGQFARNRSITRLFTVGGLSAHAAAAFGVGAMAYPDRATLAADLARALAPGVRVLVKGSRSSGMEAVVAAVLAAHGMAGTGDSHAA